MIYWFFGYPGVGKDYIAQKFAKVADVFYINGDSLLLATEKKKIAAGTFTKQDRLKKLTRIAKYLKSLKKESAITDSLPDSTSRNFLLKKFKKHIVFIRVTTSKTKHLSQIKNRKGHFFTHTLLDTYIQKNWESIGDFPHLSFRNEEKTPQQLEKKLIAIYRKFSK